MHNRPTLQQQNPRRRKSDRARCVETLARALLAPAAVALALVTTTLPALARDANAGDVWIDTVGQPAGPGHEHDPHLPCADLNLWGAKLADTAGTFTIDSWPPSGRQQVYPSATTSASWQSTASRAPQIIAVIPAQTLIANAVSAGAHATHQGFHFKLQLRQDPQKHKTFWLQCAQPERPPATAGEGASGGGGPSGGGGTSGSGGTPSGGGVSPGGGAPGTGGPSGGGSAGGPGQPSSGGPSVSPRGSSTSLTPSTFVPRTLPNTGSPSVPGSSPYLPGLPLLVLGLLVTVRPRRWLRLVRGLRRPAAVRWATRRFLE